MKIKAVFLDFGGTLAYTPGRRWSSTGKKHFYGGIDWDEYHRTVRVLLASLGYDIEQSKMKKAIGASLQELRRHRAKGLEKTNEEIYGAALRRMDIPADDETLEMIHDSFKRHYISTFYPCSEETLKKLAEKYKLALISNTMSDQPRDMLEETGLDSLFELIICSRDLGIRKPNTAIFKYVMNKMGVLPGETVHVGDSVESDIEGALDSGITPVWIRTPDQGYWQGHAISSICDLPQLLEKMQES
jgi:HAD superfamily hydrolase (TIGR01509 family)